MTPPNISAPPTRQAGPDVTPRLRLKRRAPISGYVDGAWWPHSASLPAELPDLLAVLSVRLGTVARVIYKLDEWEAAPRRISIDGRRIGLDGFRSQPRNTVEVLDAAGNKIILLVVPAQTDPDDAHTILMAAAANEDVTSVDSLLRSSKPPTIGAPVTAVNR